MADETFQRYMLQKHGTGIAASADSSGNHVFAQQVQDAYASAGSTMSPTLSQNLRELNDITQQESVLANASFGARAALSSGGYDPVAVRRRVAELENAVMADSAEARTIGTRLTHQTSAAELRKLEMRNDMTAATFDATRDMNIATLANNTATLQASTTTMERATVVDELLTSAVNAGQTSQSLQDAYASADPRVMSAAFGTADRRIAHQMLRSARLMEDEERSSQIAGWASAATFQAEQLAADTAVTNEMLTGFLADPTARPEELTNAGIEGALAIREQTLAAQSSYVQARGQGIQDQAQLQAMGIGALRPDQKAELIASVLGDGTATTAVLDAVKTGDVQGLFDALAASPNVGENGLIAINGPDGQPMEVKLTDLLNSMLQDQKTMDQINAQRTMEMVEVEQFNIEQRATRRLLDGIETYAGRRLPAGVRTVMDTASQSAQLLMRQSLAAETPEQRAAMQDAAARVMENAREVAREGLARMGLPKATVDTIIQGHFVNTESFRTAIMQVVAGRDFGLRNQGPLATAITDLVQSKNFNDADLAEFQANPEAGLLDIGVDDAWYRGADRTKITPDELTATIEGTFARLMADNLMGKLTEIPEFQNLPPALRQNIGTVLTAAREGASGTEAMSRAVHALRIVDDALYEASTMEARMAAEGTGQPPAPPTYQRGQVATLMDDMFRDRSFAEAIAKSAGGSLEAMAVLSEYNRLHNPNVAPVGDDAAALEDIAPMAVDTIFRRFVGQTQWSAAGDAAQLRLTVEQDTMIAFGMPDIGGMMDSVGRAETALAITGAANTLPGRPATSKSPEENLAISQVRVAIMNIYARKLANPEAHRNTMFLGAMNAPYNVLGTGPGVPDVPGAGRVASREEIEAEMVALGYDPAVLDTYSLSAQRGQ